MPISGSLALWDQYGWAVAGVTNTTYGGTWSYNAEMALEWGFCYSTSIAAQTFDHYSERHGNTACNPQAPPTDDPGCCDLADAPETEDPPGTSPPSCSTSTATAFI